MNYVAQTASNLRTQWAGTPPIPSRRSLEKAVLFSTEHDSRQPTYEEFQAIVTALADLVDESNESALAVGTRVQAGEPGTEDYDTGTIVNFDRGPQVDAALFAIVAWDSGPRSTHLASDLRPL